MVHILQIRNYTSVPTYATNLPASHCACTVVPPTSIEQPSCPNCLISGLPDRTTAADVSRSVKAVAGRGAVTVSRDTKLIWTKVSIRYLGVATRTNGSLPVTPGPTDTQRSLAKGYALRSVWHNEKCKDRMENGSNCTPANCETFL